MSFKKPFIFVEDLNYLLAGLEEEPFFEPVHLRDRNPLSGREKARTVFNPNKSMRKLHCRFQKLLSDSGVVFGLLFNSAAKDSIYSNAQAHSENRFFYQTDIKNAFGSVSLDRLTEILSSIRKEWNSEILKSFLEKFFFSSQGGLVVGGPASPLLFNIYAAKVLDEPLNKLWSQRGRVYTRYCDDLTFSSLGPISASLRREIRQVIEEAGFQVNHRKSTLIDLKKKNVVICGVGLEYRKGRRARIFLPRHYLKRLKGLLYLIVKDRIWVNPQIIEGMFGVIAPHLQRKRERGETLSRREQELLELYIKYRDILARKNVRAWWETTLWNSRSVENAL